MQKLRSVLVGIVVLALFLGIFTLFMPRHVTVIRSVMLRAPRDSVQAFLEDLHQWPRWCTWMGTDSAVKRVYSPKEQTVTWFPVGHPENKAFISILQSVPGDVRLFYQFKNLLPASGGFYLSRQKDSTFLQWTLEVHLRWYPWEKLSGVALDKVWGHSMDESLRRLKSGVYGEPVPPAEDVAP